MRRFSIKATGLVLLSLWTFLVMPTNIQAASPSLAQPTLDQLIEEGMAHNQEIESLENRVESLKEKIPLAGSLDDPRLGFAILNLPTDTFSFEQEAMTQKQIFIAQKIPWFGKLSLRSQRTALKAMRQQAILEAKRLELTREIATAYYQLGFVAESLEINERLTNIIDQLIAVAETRYATGRGLQQDVLQAQVELLTRQ
jgi:outer membrane protein TolC